MRFTTVKSYDNLNRLASVVNTPTASPALSAFYQYNAANQRTKLTRETSAYWDYGYDSLGQVTSAKKSLPGGVPMLGHDFGYLFDDIGNRKTATTNGQTSTYTRNLLNQYDSRTVPGVIDVVGAAQADATVTVTFPALGGAIYPTARQGEHYFKQLTVDNSTAAQSASIKVIGVKNNVGPNGEDAIAEEIRDVLVTGTPEVFTHDADGNLTGDAKWTYTWDGENRLIAMETSAVATAAGVPRRKLEFAYDGQSRRIAKNVYDWDGTAWLLGSSTRFLYDGWNMIAELDALSSNAATRTYVWGLDLSGSMQGAGGVGGLLFAYSLLPTPNSAAYAAAFDGNGNVIGLVDMATGAKSATYEYGAFGETLIADGVAAEAMPFRFSTKYRDSETGLIFFPHRLYDPPSGRWLSRDPAAESAGGPNLYAMVSNDPVNRIDPLGLWETAVHHDIVDRWLPDDPYLKYKIGCCTIDVKWQLKAGSDDVDGEPFSLYASQFLSAQSTKNAYQHALRQPDESVASAEAKYNRFITDNILAARLSARDFRDHGGDCYYIAKAIRNLGRACHAYSDNLSPAHSGFQPWWGPVDGTMAFGPEGYLAYLMVHHRGETFEVYDQMAPSVVSQVRGKFQGTLDDILNSASK